MTEDAMAWEISWVDMCRTCMEVDGELLPLYDEDAEINGNDYAYKLGQIASIEINKYDGLPSKICDKCAYRTNAFYDFQSLIRESEKRLKEIYNAQYTTDDKSRPITDTLDNTYYDEIQNQDCFSGKKDVTSDLYNKYQVVLQAVDVNVNEAAYVKGLENVCNTVILNVEKNTNNLTNIDDKVENIRVVFESNESRKYVNGQNNSEIQQSNVLSFKNIESKSEEEQAVNNISSENYSNITSQTLDENETSNLSNLKVHDNCNNDRDNSDSDSDNYLDTRENIVGSISDTITRIKEIKENGKIVLYRCTLCLSQYPNLSEILCHIVDMHVPTTGPFYCVVCEMDCKDIKELRMHVKTHKGPNPYICFLCNKSYVMKRYLKRHMACHTDFSRYRCTKCGQRFKFKKELESHANSSHGKEAQIFKCSQCTRVFNHKGNYKRHLISHLDPKGIHLPKYPCTVCDKRFLNNRTLVTHMRVHTGEKPYQCKVCRKTFSQQGNLLNHVRIHTNPRHFKCDICGKRFNQKSTLRDHKLLHSGEKPYVCNICGKSFTFSAALRRHIWSHSDRKPYECDICNAKFVGKYDIRRHLNVHNAKRIQKNSKSKKRMELLNPIITEKVDVVTGENSSNSKSIFVEEIFLCDNDNLEIIPEGKLKKEDVDSLLELMQY